MKPNLIIRLGVLLALSALAVYVLAQSVAPVAPASTLDDAIALLTEGKPQQAKELLATIEAGDPTYDAARRYYALCLYELKDHLGFLNAVEKLEVSAPVVPPEIREDLAFKRIDALFYFRKFEDIFPKIRAFRTEHPASARLDATVEYQLAALFERGMKKTYEASLTTDTNRFNARWTEGKTNLEEFLSLASSFPGTNYSIFPKRVLREDLWVAHMALGDEDAALNEIPIQDLAAREKLRLLRLRLYQKLKPDQTDQNLQMMSDFLEEFPETRSRPRVEFDMASIAFHRGERLCREAEAVEQTGDTNAAAAQRAAAGRYFALARPLQSRAVEDKEAGVEASDLRELREGLLCSFYWEKDYASLATLTASLIASSAPGDEDWLRAKVFDGAALGRQTPPKLSEAAAAFDEVLAFGFKGKPEHDRFVAMAARWRVQVARQAGDEAKARQVVQWVQAANCTKDIKAAFLKDYPQFAAQQQPNPE